MLPRILRRLLWVPVTLATVSVLTFLVLSFLPDRAVAEAALVGPAEEVVARRARFLDLPLFWNLAPRDARVRSLEAWQRAGEPGEDGDRARAELVTIGGAALPHVLPALDALAPAARTRAALGLAPLADRMGLPDRDAARDPARASAYWARFWEDRGIEFRRASVESAVERISRYRSEARAAELAELDTYALEAIMQALPTPEDRRGVEEARAIVGLAARATGREDRVAPQASVAEAVATVKRWRSWWAVHRIDYVTLDGPGRVTATVMETQYGKWAWRAVTGNFGEASPTTSVLGELRRRAPVTAVIVAGALAIAYGAATALGLLAAASRGRRLDLGIALVVLALFVLPPAVVAVAARQLSEGGLLVPTLVVAAGMIAMPTRLLRASLVSVLERPYAAAAAARGASPARVLVVHGLRNAFLPALTLATLEPPVAFGGAIVVEKVFGLQGLGAATTAALASRQVDWLMAVALVAAATATGAVLLADLILAALDPRVRRFFGGSV